MSFRPIFSFLRWLAWPVLFAASAALADPPPLPLQAGEKLKYRVSWAVVPGAGEIEIDGAADTSTAPPRLVVTTNTATRGLAKMLMRFEAVGQSFYDAASGRLLELRESAVRRRKSSAHTVTFDYEKHEAKYLSTEPPAEPRTLPIPEGNPSDLIMALLQTRTWDLQPGQSRDALVLFDDDFYELTIHALRYENVRTPLGQFRTLVLEPRMDKTEPKGMFRKGASVHVWIAQNDSKLPVKFEVEFKIGTGTATLESYTPPTAKATVTPTNAEAAGKTPATEAAGAAAK